MAVNIITQKLFGPKKAQSQSPTYSLGPMSTQCDNTLPIPMIYGKVKMAGNIIWSDNGSTVQNLIISYGLGPIKGFTDVRINDIPITSLPGCSYTAYVGDGDQLIDSRVPGATQAAKAEVVGGLKYDAYLAITATPSDQLSSVNTVTAIVEGRLVRIYTAVNTYTTTWTDSPPWCTLDFEMSDNGCGMEEANVDIQSYITAAAYCDALVSGQKRFTLNLTLDETKARQDWLTEMLFCYRAYPTYQRGLHGIFVESPVAVSQVFTIQPDEEISFSWAELGEEIERLRLTYIDPTYDWVKVEARAEAASFRSRLPVEKSVEMFGVTNFNQASRLAWFYQNLYQTCKQSMTYRTNRRALNRTIGDRIQTNDPIMEMTNKDWRILSMTETQDGKIEMTCREYNEALYTDALGSVAPVVNVTKITGHYVAPVALASFRVSVSGGNVVFNWSGLAANADGVEIRSGSSFASGQLAAKVTKEALQATSAAVPGDMTYWAAAYNTGGYSEALSDSISIDAISDRVAVLDSNNYQAGATITGNGGLIGQTIAQDSLISYDDIKDLSYDELKDRNLMIGTGTGMVIAGATIDLGKVADVVFTPKERWLIAPDKPVIYEVQTSIDGSIFSDWKLMPSGTISTRHINLRAIVNGLATVGLLSRIDIKITAEKTTEEFFNVTIPVGGYDFVFKKSYVNPPYFSFSPNNGARHVQRSSFTRFGGHVDLLDPQTLEDTGGEGDGFASGF